MLCMYKLQKHREILFWTTMNYFLCNMKQRSAVTVSFMQTQRKYLISCSKTSATKLYMQIRTGTVASPVLWCENSTSPTPPRPKPHKSCHPTSQGKVKNTDCAHIALLWSKAELHTCGKRQVSVNVTLSSCVAQICFLFQGLRFDFYNFIYIYIYDIDFVLLGTCSLNRSQGQNLSLQNLMNM